MNKEQIKNLKEELLYDIEHWFDEHKSDCKIVLEAFNLEHKAELMFGFDVFTVKEDGTVDNTENDTKHYYIEVWNNFNDEEGYRLGDGSPAATFWLDELDMPIEDILIKALAIMGDICEGKYDENKGGKTNAQN